MGTASPLEAPGADGVAIEVNARIRMRRLVSNGALNLGYVESVDGADVLVRLDRGPRIVVPAADVRSRAAAPRAWVTNGPASRRLTARAGLGANLPCKRGPSGWG